jgi:hypothetical protein
MTVRLNSHESASTRYSPPPPSSDPQLCGPIFDTLCRIFHATCRWLDAKSQAHSYNLPVCSYIALRNAAAVFCFVYSPYLKSIKRIVYVYVCRLHVQHLGYSWTRYIKWRVAQILKFRFNIIIGCRKLLYICWRVYVCNVSILS